MDKSVAPEAPRLSFSQIAPNLQLAWDSTSMSALKRCPRYYQYSILEGYRGKIESVHLRFGSEYNNALVTYNMAIAAGEDHESATLKAVKYALTSTWDEALGRPWTSDLPVKTRETLVRSVIWYLDKFADDPCKTVVLKSGKSAVELSFRLHIDKYSALTDEPYLICGYLDRMVTWNDSLWILDWKTSRSALDQRYFAEYTPNNQVSQYTFAGNIIGGQRIKGVIIDAVQLGVNFSRFQRSHITRTPAQLDEWYNDLVYYMRLNESYVENNYWPMNDAVCGLYGGCPFRAICSTSPELRQTHLNALYTRRKWDPLQIREI